jgi:hypothetical protein
MVGDQRVVPVLERLDGVTLTDAAIASGVIADRYSPELDELGFKSE